MFGVLIPVCDQHLDRVLIDSLPIARKLLPTPDNGKNGQEQGVPCELSDRARVGDRVNDPFAQTITQLCIVRTYGFVPELYELCDMLLTEILDHEMPEPCRIKSSSLISDDTGGDDDTRVFILGCKRRDTATHLGPYRRIKQLVKAVEHNDRPPSTQGRFQNLTWNTHLFRGAQMVKKFLEGSLSPFGLSIPTQFYDDRKAAGERIK